jgi:hypothetical protein
VTVQLFPTAGLAEGQRRRDTVLRSVTGSRRIATGSSPTPTTRSDQPTLFG